MLPLLLILAWAIVLVPPIVQRLLVHRPSSPSNADALGALARRQQMARPGDVAAAPAPPGMTAVLGGPMPVGVEQAGARRRLCAAVLGGLALVTLVLFPVVGPVMLVPHLLVDAALAGFVWLWWQRHQGLDADTASVVALSSLRPAARPAPAMLPADTRRVS